MFYGAGVENKPLKKSFIVTISEASNTMQGVLNVGGQITLSEIVDDFEIVTFANVLSKREFKAGTYTFITNSPQSLLTYVEDEEGYKFIEVNGTDGDYSTTQTFTKDTIVVGWSYTWR